MNSPTIRRFFRTSIGFGLLMGVVFPFYALLFATFETTLSLVLFSVGCLLAGLTVGSVSYYIGKKLILDWIQVRSHDLGEISRPGSVVDLDLSRQLGEISPNFTRFFTGLDRELKALQSEARNTETVAHRLDESVAQTLEGIARLSSDSRDGEASIRTLTELIRQTTQSGLALASSGGRVFDELTREEATFADLADCGDQVVNAQRSLAERTLAEFQRNRELLERITVASACFRDLSQLQTRVGTVVQMLIEAVGSMEEMASRANILSMNASILAARAGVAGKGFAVVAGEMRNQSDVSAAQAHELKTSLAGIADEFAQGERSIAQAVEVFDKIQSSSEASRENLTAMDAATEQFLRSGQSLQDNMKRVSSTLRLLKSLAEQLQQASASFAQLGNNRETEQAQTLLTGILGESQRLEAFQAGLSESTAQLFASVKALRGLLERFRLLDAAATSF